MPTSRRPRSLLLTEMAEANRSDLMTRRRRGPATEPPDIERDLVGLVADPLYWQDRDEDYFQYVKAQFDRVYGDGPVARDASGRQRQPQPKRPFATGQAGLEFFAPPPRPEALRPAAPVGRGAAPQRAGGPVNRRPDVVGLQKALASLGWYRWQPPGEPSGQITPTLDTALRAFQQASGLAVDGRVDPDGPTLRRLAQASGLPLNTPNDQPPDTPASEPRFPEGTGPNGKEANERLDEVCEELARKISDARDELDAASAGLRKWRTALQDAQRKIDDIRQELYERLDETKTADRDQDLIKMMWSLLQRRLPLPRGNPIGYLDENEDGSVRVIYPKTQKTVQLLNDLKDAKLRRRQTKGRLDAATERHARARENYAAIEEVYARRCSGRNDHRRPQHSNGGFEKTRRRS